uniref:Uncharacterized protein n=1 Tax=Ciona savignyi TaxID=51511 RepID=H2Y411_CIOSA
MLRWLRGDEQQKEPEVFESVALGLKKLYKNRLRPLEDAYKFHDFHSPALDDADFDSKPMVLLVGQYSTGKTTFIRYLLEQDFPGMRIGPEPTTDCFIAIMHGDLDKATNTINEGVIPGNALVIDKTKPFRALSSFGNNFLSRLQCSQMKNQVLQSISIIDTPGILSGEKQRVNRGYDFSKVLTWMAERVDRIILLFDAHKLDISDEFHEALNAVKMYDSKIRVVLNKCDQVNTQQLMRVYGALMWSLGKILQNILLMFTKYDAASKLLCILVVRVYIGSFWDQPLLYDENRILFEAERNDLFEDIQSLPRNAALRKLNDLIKRARLAKEMRKNLKLADFTKFRGLSESMIKKVDEMLSRDIAELMTLIQREEAKMSEQIKQEGPAVKGKHNIHSPMGLSWGEGINAGSDFDTDWIVGKKKPEYDEIFMKLSPCNGKVKGSEAKKEMVKSKLPHTALAKVWRLADHDRDGQLTEEEFALSMHLINIRLEGFELPDELPEHLVPPSQRSK